MSLYPPLPPQNLLIVGAGGIGSELLKNAVLAPNLFHKITIVDLDTIDISNLNRQFLFAKKDVGKFKAEVAAEVARGYNSKAKITAIHGNVFEERFGAEWISQFDVVCNALDNWDDLTYNIPEVYTRYARFMSFTAPTALTKESWSRKNIDQARKRINALCVQTNTPLVESGTSGYNGQTTVHWKGKFECVDCTRKEVAKTFPVCTIRSTPSQFIHCIVWAKSWLLGQLFGPEDDVEMEISSTESANAKELETLRNESKAMKGLRDAMGTKEYNRKVFKKVFYDDIEHLRAVPELWKTRTAPVSVDLTKLDLVEDTKLIEEDHKIWTIAQCAQIFLECVDELATRYKSTGTDITFDKDDECVMLFVAVAANLRSYIYHIKPESLFEAKSKAGNIIPAIATTNAIIAGFIILTVYKLLQKKYEECFSTFVGYQDDKRIFWPVKPEGPNPLCTVCNLRYVDLTLDCDTSTLQDILMAAQQIGLEGDLMINEGSRLLYDADFESNISKTLVQLNVRSGLLLLVGTEDDDGMEDVGFVLKHESGKIGFRLGETGILKQKKPKPPAVQNPVREDVTMEGDTMVIEDDDMEVL